jgi:iron-sulfur cluster repair protein YtfE (RIC family)
MQMQTQTDGSTIPAGLTVNEMIRLHPQTVEVFNRFGIDACCGGAVPVREAAVRDGADAVRLLEALDAVIAR